MSRRREATTPEPPELRRYRTKEEYLTDFQLYLADPEFAAEVGALPEPSIDPSPQSDAVGGALEPGDVARDGYGFLLVYEGALRGEAMVHHVSDGAPARRRFAELVLHKKRSPA